MNIITIKPLYGDEMKITTDGELWGFRAGDKITDESPHNSWYQKTVIVKGFSLKGNGLWGQAKGDLFCLMAFRPDNLVRLE